MPERAPWCLRWSERPGWSPLRMSLAIAAALGVLFLGAELALGRLAVAGREPKAAADVQVALALIALVSYLPGAFAACVPAAERMLRELAPAFAQRGEAEAAAASVAGRCEDAGLRRAGVLGVVAALLVPLATNLELATWALWELPPEAVAHRLLLAPLGWFTARAGVVVWRESQRLAQLGAQALRVDLLDLRPLSALGRAGVRHALVSAGVLSLLQLGFYGADVAPGLPFVLALVTLANLALSGAALWLALKGGHAAIQREKARACEAANLAIRALREPGAKHAAGALADALAWRRFVTEAPDWPIDFPTLQRFVVPLALPLASLLAGAALQVVLERLIAG